MTNSKMLVQFDALNEILLIFAREEIVYKPI